MTLTDKNNIIVAIDGPSGSGKSTVSLKVAEKLGYSLIDTGAMFRVVGLQAHNQGISLDDENRLEEVASKLHIEFKIVNGINRIIVSGEDITDSIRTPEVGELASKVSTRQGVRTELLKLQRTLSQDKNIVMEGRDIGTVVFPDATIKFFVTATSEERAKRRWLELKAKGQDRDLEEIHSAIKSRDHRDSNRDIAPLRQAPGAILVVTDGMTIEQVVDFLYDKVQEVVQQD